MPLQQERVTGPPVSVCVCACVRVREHFLKVSLKPEGFTRYSRITAIETVPEGLTR